MDKPALASELEDLRREIEARLDKTKSQSNFRNSLDSEDIDTDAFSECSFSLTNENDETLDPTSDISSSILDGSTEKDTCDPDGVNGDNLNGDKENEEILKGKEIDGEVDDQVIENDEDDSIEKGTELIQS
jgi:hypothetical protein